MNLPLSLGLRALLFGLSLSALAAEPEPAPEPAPPTGATEPAASPPATAVETSAWLQSFPAERRRPLTGYPGVQALLLWPPVKPWRGDSLLLPGAANSGRASSLLLPLAEQLAAAGWRCWLLPREQPGPLPADTTLDPALALIRAEPAPPSKAAGVDKPGLFLVAEADVAVLALTSMTAGTIGGAVLLAPTLPATTETEPPTRPVLEIDRLPTTPDQQSRQRVRIQRWRQQPGYQFHTLALPAQTDGSLWLSHIVDGWLRKTSTASAQTASGNGLKKPQTAPAGASKP